MNEPLTHISLFTGIGGFDLAASWAGFRTIAMCEIDPFCQEVLKARFGAVADTDGTRLQIYERGNSLRQQGPSSASASGDRPILIPDIRDFDGTRFRGATLLTGGFPCQPFSHAGKRRGTSDDRHLWPEMLRVIDEARPTYVLGENVSGIRSLEIGQGDADLEGDTDDEPGGEDEYTIVLDGVCRDLEGIGYEVQPLIIPACAVNAPHRRDRVWILARRIDKDPIHDRVRVGEPQEQVRERNERDPLTGDGKRIHHKSHDTHWDIPWISVAIATCDGRVDDGLPAWVHSRRVARLKALGNAVVPQIPAIICSYIAQIERGEVNHE